MSLRLTRRTFLAGSAAAGLQLAIPNQRQAETEAGQGVGLIERDRPTEGLRRGHGAVFGQRREAFHHMGALEIRVELERPVRRLSRPVPVAKRQPNLRQAGPDEGRIRHGLGRRQQRVARRLQPEVGLLRQRQRDMGRRHAGRGRHRALRFRQGLGAVVPDDVDHGALRQGRPVVRLCGEYCIEYSPRLVGPSDR